MKNKEIIMPYMNLGLLKSLNATSGAFSVVTSREATGDRSITLDRYEKAILEQKYDLNKVIRRGSYTKDQESDRLNFITISDYRLDHLERKDIPVVYPKDSGNEIRLYMQGRMSFQGNANDIFIIFIRPEEDVPIIGFLSQHQWIKLLELAEMNFILSEQDNDDDNYQKNIALKQAGHAVISNTLRLPRNFAYAQQALENANFKCEYNKNHNTFISPITKSNFMEAHHLIPLAWQNDYSFSLDNINNIFSLCPNCHRKIHCSDRFIKKEMLEKLYSSREHFFTNQLETNFDRLCFYYGI